MVSILSMINSYLSYINLNVKIKNRIYTCLAFVGNFYLLYVSYRFFSNGYIWRGFLFILAFLVILYFAYLNTLYYFTKDKRSKYDVSPFIEKKFHLKPKDPLTDAAKKQQTMGFVQTNGIFKNEDFLPADIDFSPIEKANIQAVVQDLRNVGYLSFDYSGQTDDSLYQLAQEGKPQHAIGELKALPYFELVPEGNELYVYGGVNQINRHELGHVKTVGLMPAIEAAKKYHLYLATAVLTGGPVKVAGRSDVIEKDEPFILDVKIAYRKRGVKSKNNTLRQGNEQSSFETNTTNLSRRRRKR